MNPGFNRMWRVGRMAPARAVIASTAVLILVFSGCAEPIPVQRLTLDAPSFITAAGDTVQMREALRIGRLDGPDEFTFAGILWTLPTPGGGVILYDLESDDLYGHTGRVRQFDAEGRFVRYIGRPGEGPGEHRPFPMATLLTSGELLLADQGLARFTKYDSSGKVLASWPGPSAIVELQAATDGGWFVATVTGFSQGKPRPIEYVQYDSLGNEVARFPAPEVYHSGPAGGSGPGPLPTSDVAILPDGRMVSNRSDSLLVVISGRDSEVRVGAPHQPVTYQPGEADALRAAVAGIMMRTGRSATQMAIPEFKPAVGGMRVDRGGRVLLLLRTEGYLGDTTVTLRENQTPWREPMVGALFDSTATYRGRLVAPRHITRGGASFSDDAVWLVEEGESGELYLVKWVPERSVW